MKKFFMLGAALFALALAAEPLDLQMPFKKGRKDAVAWWKTKGQLVDVDGGKAVAL